MRKYTLAVIAALGLLGLVVFLALKRHSTEIIHIIVENAIQQKAPDGFPASRIKEAFDRSLAAAARNGRESDYVKKLKLVFHQTERMQHLDAAEIEMILTSLQDASGS